MHRGGGGAVLRLWEVAGKAGPVTIGLSGYKKPVLTDLLERDQKEIAILDGSVAIGCKPYGFCGLRLLP